MEKYKLIKINYDKDIPTKEEIKFDNLKDLLLSIKKEIKTDVEHMIKTNYSNISNESAQINDLLVLESFKIDGYTPYKYNKECFEIYKGDEPICISWDKIKEIDEKSKEPIGWAIYDDGSGHLIGQFDRIFFSYDKFTNEIRYPNGRYGYCDFKNDWKKKYEDLYTEHILPIEQKYNEYLKKGIILTDFWDTQYKKDKQKASYIYINENYNIAKDDFNKILNECHELEDKNFSDTTINDFELTKKINNSLCENKFEFEYEGKIISINENSLVKNIDDIER